MTGTDEGRGRLHEGQEKGVASPRSPSISSSQLQGLLLPASHPRRRTVAGSTNREALLFPEETSNNRAETSGAAHLTDGPVSASQGTRPYFQNTISPGPFHTSESTNTESSKLPLTQRPVKASSAAGSSDQTASRTHTLFAISPDYPSVSGSTIPSLTSSLPDLPSWTTWKTESTLKPHEVSLAPGEKEPNSWRGPRSTDRLSSDLVSAATSGPLNTQQKGESGAGPTTSAFWTSVRNAGGTDPSPSRLTVPPTAVEAFSFHPHADDESGASVTLNVTTGASVSASSGESESTQVSRTFTPPPRSQTSSLRSPAITTRSELSHLTSPFIRASKDSSPTAPTLRDSEPASLLPDWITSAPPPPFSSFSSPPGAAATLEDAAQKAAATGSRAGSQSQTQGPTFTRLHHQLPTASPTPVPHFSSAHSHKLQSHTTSPSTHTASTTAEPTPVTPVTPGPSPVKSTPPHSPHQPATRNKSHDFGAPASTPASEHTHGEEKEEQPWQWLPSSTPGGQPGTSLRVHPENHTAPSSDAPASTSSQTPRFFIVPDQPAAIKGAPKPHLSCERSQPGSVMMTLFDCCLQWSPLSCCCKSWWTSPAQPPA